MRANRTENVTYRSTGLLALAENGVPVQNVPFLVAAVMALFSWVVGLVVVLGGFEKLNPKDSTFGAEQT